MDLVEIVQLTQEYAKLRAVLEGKVADLQTEIATLRRQGLPGIKTAVECAGEAHTALHEAISASPELFMRPKSLLLAGVVVGYQKDPDRLEWANSEQVVAAIQEHLPTEAKVLIKTTHTPVVKTLQLLDDDTLRKLGVTRDVGRDRVIIQPANSEIDKLVEAFTKEAEAEPVGA
jgi:hypothetical protein